MTDPSRINAELIEELSVLKQRTQELEHSESDRKQAEEALRESEERYHRIADTVTDYIFTSYIEDGKVVKTVHGPGCIAVTRYSAEEFAADPYLWFNMVFPEDRDRVEKYAARILTGKNLDPVEHRIRRKDGRVRWVQNTPVPHYDSSGALISYDGLISDITLRKRAEERLRESEEKYRLLVENANETIMVIQDGMVKFVNSRAVASFGYLEQEFLSIPAFEFIHPEDRDVVVERYRQKINGDTTPTRHTYRTIHKSGQIQWIEISSVLIEWEGRPATMNLVTDITEHRKAEEEKRSLEAQLIQAQKMEAIGTLAGGIAHDFNNLLMGIQGYASLSLMDLDASHPHYERLKRIEEQVESGADLTRQLLGFARGGRYDVKPADMNDIIKETSSMFGRTKKEISIHRKYGKDLRPVEVDRGQMEQVFMNLYVNAWQAMPGGGEIYLETENVLLDDEQAFPYAVTPGRYVKITVTDTGTGMDEKTRERIFDPFFTTKEMGRGTGLGLATVYGIIKGHKGMINVDSEPGHGTTFTIYLPASEKEVVKEKTATGTIARGTETILLVDDEKMIL